MLEEKIYKDYFHALKEHNKHKSGFLSFIRAEFKNIAISVKKEKLDDNEVLVVLNKQKKRLEETRESIIKSGRSDLLENLEKELSLLNDYLPKPLEDSELADIIAKVATDVGASSVKDMGKVMKEVMANVGVRADSKKVSDLVRNKLSAG